MTNFSLLKKITTYTRNVGLKNIMQIEEKCVYKPDPSSPDQRTIVERQAWISSSLAGWSKLVTKIGLERFKKNTQKATQGFVYVLEQLQSTSRIQQVPLGPNVFKSPGPHTVQQATEKLKEKAAIAKEKAQELARSRLPHVSAKSS